MFCAQLGRRFSSRVRIKFSKVKTCSTSLSVRPVSPRNERYEQWRVWVITAVVVYSTANSDRDGRGVVMAFWPFANRESPFDYPALRRGIQQRSQSTTKLQRFMTQTKPEVRELMEKRANNQIGDGEFRERMVELKDRVTTEAQRILYGVEDPGARQKYEMEFGCCKWTPSALKRVAALSPLVEIGAGRGHWQRALEAAGADVLAVDSGATPSPLPNLPPVGRVRHGDERTLLNDVAAGRALLLVCPPPGPMALRTLRLFRGERFALVSEGRGGVHADDAFFDALEAEWTVEYWQDLDTFPQCFERLFILRRKKEAKKPKAAAAMPAPAPKSSPPAATKSRLAIEEETEAEAAAAAAAAAMAAAAAVAAVAAAAGAGEAAQSKAGRGGEKVQEKR
ncbi:unnamed protein product [Phaeothamnion confervicola]